MISKLIPKINYPVLVQAAKNVGIDVGSYPETLPAEWDGNTEFLKKVADLAMSVDVVDGELECPESGRRFLIREGIPNMLVNDEEGQKIDK
jgi:multifunctional methyltransferase subunit TRM112